MARRGAVMCIGCSDVGAKGHTQKPATEGRPLLRQGWLA